MRFKKDLLHLLILVAGKQKDKEQSNKTSEQLSSEDDAPGCIRQHLFLCFLVYSQYGNTEEFFSAHFWVSFNANSIKFATCFDATGTQEDGSEHLSSGTFSAPCWLQSDVKRRLCHQRRSN